MQAIMLIIIKYLNDKFDHHASLNSIAIQRNEAKWDQNYLISHDRKDTEVDYISLWSNTSIPVYNVAIKYTNRGVPL